MKCFEFFSIIIHSSCMNIFIAFSHAWFYIGVCGDRFF